jgi:uncharacterized damage-inducible protein DinB
MDVTMKFERLLAYDRWANGQALESLEKLAAPPTKSVELLAHVLGAELCWLARMTAGRDAPGVEEWDTLQTLATLRVVWTDELPAAWVAFLGDAKLSDPARTFTFVDWLGNTSKPVRVEDAAMQLMFHSAHHRGQVALGVRAAGGLPATTDFLRAVRAEAI